MPSPFPGMDPFIESQRFDEFHSVYLVTLADLLVPLVRPKYAVDVERYVFLSSEDDERLYKEGQTFLTIRTGRDRKVVTMIELLSPVNKDATGGQRAYLSKRANYLRTLASVVEIDLLRGGTRLPSKPSLTDRDYSAYVVRHGDSAHVAGYSWNLQDRLPTIPVPLAEGDPDVGLDLQQAFDITYDRRGYDYLLDYSAPIDPPLAEDVQRWVEEQLAGKSD